MCVPDLLGTQGTFLLFTTRQAGERFKEGGTASLRHPRRRSNRDRRSQGPENPFATDSRPLTVPLRLTLNRGDGRMSMWSAVRASTLTPGR